MSQFHALVPFEYDSTTGAVSFNGKQIGKVVERNDGRHTVTYYDGEQCVTESPGRIGLALDDVANTWAGEGYVEPIDFNSN